MTIAPNILQQLQVEEISEEEVLRMVQSAAPYNEDGCNRRYFDWLFKVENGVLTVMRRATLLEVGIGLKVVYEEHDVCRGAGCKACGWAGEILRRRNIPRT